MLTLDQLNAASRDEFARLLAGVYEHSPWVAEAAAAARPFTSVAGLRHALAGAVRTSARAQQLELLRAHPELAGREAAHGSLSADSAQEQARAGLGALSADELATLHRLNLDYLTRFGWPFVVAVGGPRGTGLHPKEIIATVSRRLQHPAEVELAECLRQVHRIAELRLSERFGDAPVQGAQVWDWAEALAAHSDEGWRERGELTVTYLTPAHQACAVQLQAWMLECGFDEVSVDAVGNVVGVYHGIEPDADRLLTGSHFDTVRNAGKYDGRLGVLVPMACVQALHQAGRRLRCGIEVVAFAEEEGQRFKAAFLSSGALLGQFDPAWLAQTDAAGIRMDDAMRAVGLNPDAIAGVQRDPARYLGFVEVHIEQGPVLDAIDQPLGAVTSINGGVRYVGEVTGLASHAGTTPMGQRRDAALAVAELALYLEQRAASVADAVGTVGMLEVPGGSINVVPGRCRFSLDMRATTDAVRDALTHDTLTELERIAERRGVQVTVEETMRAAAAPSAPAWQARWEAAIAALGLPVVCLPSGAGHDAMKMHEMLPQAMLFVRGGNAGISHNPLETITAHDAELCVRAFAHLLDQLDRA